MCCLTTFSCNAQIVKEHYLTLMLPLPCLKSQNRGLLQFQCVFFNNVGECHWMCWADHFKNKNGPRISAVNSHQTVTCERNLQTFVFVFCSPNMAIMYVNLAIQKKMCLFWPQNVPRTFILEITLIKNFLRFTSY